MADFTKNYNFKKPLKNEYFNIDDQNGNWDKVDEELGKKPNSTDGDTADMKVSAITPSSASFPEPAAGDKQKTLWGKVKKWQQDCLAKFGNYVLMSMITNQHLNSTSNVPTSALVYLMQQAISKNQGDISVLNTKQKNKLTNTSPNRLVEAGTLSYEKYEAFVVNIDGSNYIVPMSLYTGKGIYSPLRYEVTTNPATQNRALRITWFADGTVYKNYLDFTL